MAYSPKNANGQATMANSEPVVIASDQSTVPVSVASLPLPTGAATSAKQDTIIGHVDGIEGLLTTIDADTGSIDSKTPALGQALAAASVPVVLPAAQITTLTPPAAITGYATAAAQTDKSQFTKLTDGTDTALVTAAGELNVIATAQPGVDVGDVTINNASGASAVNIQDGGNSITVDGTVAVTGVSTLAEQQTQTTSLQLLDDTVFTDDTSTHTTGTTKGLGIMAVANPTDASVDANDMGMVAMTTARALKNDITSIAGTAAVNGSGNATGALRVELPTNGTGVIASISTSVVPGTAATNLGKARDSAIGATDTGIAMLGVRRDSPTAETPAAGDYIVPQYSANGEAWTRLSGELADDAAFTVGTTRVVPVGMMADETSTDSVDEGDAGVPRITLDRKQIVTVQPHTQGGLSVFNATSSDGATALTSTAQAIKASAGQVYGWYIYNPNATAQFVQLYNTAAASVTVGTTNPLFMLTIPATSAANVEFTNGITFSNAGFSCAATSTAGGSGAPGTALDAVIFYK